MLVHGSFISLFAQETNNEAYMEVKGYFHHDNNVIPDVFPQFPGGTNGLLQYIAKNMVYPESAKKQNIYGEVIVRYVVEKDGSIKDAEIIKGLSEDVDRECLRVFKSMKGWKPGIKDGKPVRIEYKQPVQFDAP